MAICVSSVFQQRLLNNGCSTLERLANHGDNGVSFARELTCHVTFGSNFMGETNTQNRFCRCDTFRARSQLSLI